MARLKEKRKTLHNILNKKYSKYQKYQCSYATITISFNKSLYHEVCKRV